MRKIASRKKVWRWSRTSPASSRSVSPHVTRGVQHTKQTAGIHPDAGGRCTATDSPPERSRGKWDASVRDCVPRYRSSTDQYALSSECLPAAVLRRAQLHPNDGRALG